MILCETLIYAEGIQREYNGQDFANEEIERVFRHTQRLNESIIYYLDAHPEWIPWYLDNILIGLVRSLPDFIKFFEHFDPSFQLAKPALEKLEKNKFNQCVVEWLKEKL